MKRVTLMTAACLLAVAPALAGIAVGDPIPSADVAMKSVDGKELTLAAAKGAKGTLVVFTCNHCPFAKAWEDRIVELGNAYASKGIGVVAINSNDPKVNTEDGYEQMVARSNEKKMAFPYVVDATSGVARAFGASKTPEAFLFDAGGKLVYHGTIDDNAREPEKVVERYLADALDAVVAGKAPAKAETKALGCSIKFRAEG